MKRFMKQFLVALIISALASISVIAGDKNKSEKREVTFPDDVMVNGTLVIAGTYTAKFDETTGELSILKGSKVKAKTTAHLQARSDKAKNTAIRLSKSGNVAELAGVTFSGSNRDVIVGGTGAVTGMQ